MIWIHYFKSNNMTTVRTTDYDTTIQLITRKVLNCPSDWALRISRLKSHRTPLPETPCPTFWFHLKPICRGSRIADSIWKEFRNTHVTCFWVCSLFQSLTVKLNRTYTRDVVLKPSPCLRKHSGLYLLFVWKKYNSTLLTITFNRSLQKWTDQR